LVCHLLRISCWLFAILDTFDREIPSFTAISVCDIFSLNMLTTFTLTASAKSVLLRFSVFVGYSLRLVSTVIVTTAYSNDPLETS